MFKDYTKYLATSLEVYLFVLIIIFIMKLVGLDYFGLDINNIHLMKLNDLCLKYKMDIIWSYVNCFINSFVIISIVCNDNSRKILKYVLCVFPIIVIFQYLKYFIPIVFINNLMDLIVFILICYFYNKRILIKKYLLVSILLSLLQYVSIFIRNQSLEVNDYNFIVSLLMNFDYIVMILIIYKIYFMKGEIQCYQVEVQYSSLLKKINLKKLLAKLRRNLHNFIKLDRETRLTYIIYFTFSLLWNTLSVLIILLVAKLNDTFIECLFILTSFWLSKRTFGKAFHLSSMTQCFVVSNLTYYTLNRITTPLGISIIVPILLGVGLSYVTSKLVRKSYKPLYKGMPQETFEETILKVVDKDSDKYKICYDYFINKKSALYLSGKYNYTEAGIRKIKDRINKKIKELE